MKKVSAIALSLIMLFSMSSCKSYEEKEKVQETTTHNAIREEVEEIVTGEAVTEKATAADDEEVTVESEETTLADDEITSPARDEETTKKTALSDEWTKEKIAEVYKKAARKI